MSKRSYTGPLLLIGGGALTAGAIWWASRKSAAVADATADAVRAGGTFKVRSTGYWPFQSGLSAAERKMEGAPVDRRGGPLYTLEQHIAGNAPYVSVSGDDSIFPYGQRLSLDAWPGAIFRVTDTGGHFRGASKVYRVFSAEPLDICVDSSKTPVPKLVTARIFAGDNFERGKAVAVSRIKDQTVSLTGRHS
jgi:hypothetical protein